MEPQNWPKKMLFSEKKVKKICPTTLKKSLNKLSTVDMTECLLELTK